MAATEPRCGRTPSCPPHGGPADASPRHAAGVTVCRSPIEGCGRWVIGPPGSSRGTPRPSIPAGRPPANCCGVSEPAPTGRHRRSTPTDLRTVGASASANLATTDLARPRPRRRPSIAPIGPGQKPGSGGAGGWPGQDARRRPRTRKRSRRSSPAADRASVGFHPAGRGCPEALGRLAVPPQQRLRQRRPVCGPFSLTALPRPFGARCSMFSTGLTTAYWQRP
jgi:hypothetical protein